MSALISGLALMAATIGDQGAPPPKPIVLACTGTQTLSRNDMAKPMAMPWAQTIVINLAQQRYCASVCGGLSAADLADPSRIVLRQPNAHHLSLPAVYEIATGAISSREVQDLTPTTQAVIDRHGRCVARP